MSGECGIKKELRLRKNIIWRKNDPRTRGTFVRRNISWKLICAFLLTGRFNPPEIINYRENVTV